MNRVVLIPLYFPNLSSRFLLFPCVLDPLGSFGVDFCRRPHRSSGPCRALLRQRPPPFTLRVLLLSPRRRCQLPSPSCGFEWQWWQQSRRRRHLEPGPRALPLNRRSACAGGDLQQAPVLPRLLLGHLASASLDGACDRTRHIEREAFTGRGSEDMQGGALARS